MLQLSCKSAFEAFFDSRLASIEAENKSLIKQNNKLDETIRDLKAEILFITETCALYQGALVNLASDH